MSNVLVIAELEGGKVRKGTYSAVAFAREVAKAGGSFAILAMGAGAQGASSELAGYGASKVIVVDQAALGHQICEHFAPTIAAVAKGGGFDVVVATASSFGKDVAPRVAAKLGAGYAPDISAVRTDGGKLVFRRPIYAGNAFGLCEIQTPVKVVTVRQGGPPRDEDSSLPRRL